MILHLPRMFDTPAQLSVVHLKYTKGMLSIYDTFG